MDRTEISIEKVEEFSLALIQAFFGLSGSNDSQKLTRAFAYQRLLKKLEEAGFIAKRQERDFYVIRHKSDSNNPILELPNFREIGFKSAQLAEKCREKYSLVTGKQNHDIKVFSVKIDLTEVA